MKRRNTSWMIVAAACAALLAAPAMAADAPAAKGSMPPAKSAPMKGASVKKKHKRSCYDYAWQSQDMKDCLAKQASAGQQAPAAKHGKKKAAKTKS